MAADARVADIMQAGKIRVAMFLPTYTQDAATGELRGRGVGIVMIEIAHVLATRLGVKAQIVGYPTPSSVVERLDQRLRHGIYGYRAISGRGGRLLISGFPP